MILKSLHLVNYCKFKDTYIEFPLGVTGILGQHVEGEPRSNGSGKTTLLHAPLFAITGKDRGDVVSDLVGDHGEEMYVTLEYLLDNHTYKIKRGVDRGEGLLEYYIDNTDVSESIPETKKRIIKDTGDKTHDVYLVTSFFQQQKHDIFTLTGDTAKLQYIRKLRNLDYFDIGFKLINDEKIKPSRKNKEFYEINIKNIKEEITNFKSDENIEKEINESNTEIENLLTQVQELNQKKQSYIKQNMRSETIENEINNLNQQIEQKNNLINTKQENLKTLEANLETTKQEINEIVADIDSLEQEAKDYNLKINNIKFSRITDSFCNSKNDELNDLKNKKSIVDSKIKELNNSYIKWENVKPGETIECKECLTSLLPENKDQQIEKIQSRLSNKLEEQKSLQELITNNQKQLEEFKKLNELNRTNQQLKSQYTLKIENCNNIISEKQSLFEIKNKNKNDIITMIDNEKNEIINYTNEIKELYELKTQKEKEKGIDYNTEIEKINNEINFLENQKTNLQQKKTEIVSLKNRKKEIIQKKQDLEKKYNELINQIKCDEKLLHVWGKTGVSSILTDSIIQELNIITNRYISNFEPSVSVEFVLDKEKGKLKIYVMESSKRRIYKMWSGGEKTLINLSIRLALSDVLNLKAIKKTQFLVLDEVFGSLDDINREKAATVFNTLTNKFSQIFVISHTDMKDTFEHLIHIDRYKTYSTAKLIR